MTDPHPAPEMLPADDFDLCLRGRLPKDSFRASRTIENAIDAALKDFPPPTDPGPNVTRGLYANPAASQRMLDDPDFDIENWLAVEIASEMARAGINVPGPTSIMRDPFTNKPFVHFYCVREAVAALASEPPQPVVVPGEVDAAETAWNTYSCGNKVGKETFMAGYRAALTRPATDTLDTAMVERGEHEGLVERLREAEQYRDSYELDADHRKQWAERASEIEAKLAALSTATEKAPQGERAELIKRLRGEAHSRATAEPDLDWGDAAVTSDMIAAAAALTADAALIAELRERVIEECAKVADEVWNEAAREIARGGNNLPSREKAALADRIRIGIRALLPSQTGQGS